MSSTALGYLGLRLAAAIASDEAPKHPDWDMACNIARMPHMLGAMMHQHTVDGIVATLPLVMHSK